MPYINNDDGRRRELRHGCPPKNAGELNFVISELVENYLLNKGGLSYDNLNEVLGVMTAAQLELYRRLAAPYEDKKIAENGDVFLLRDRDTLQKGGDAP